MNTNPERNENRAKAMYPTGDLKYEANSLYKQLTYKLKNLRNQADVIDRKISSREGSSDLNSRIGHPPLLMA